MRINIKQIGWVGRVGQIGQIAFLSRGLVPPLVLLFLLIAWLVPPPVAAFFGPFSGRQQPAVVEESTPGAVELPTSAAVEVVEVDEAVALFRQIARVNTELLATLDEPDLKFSRLRGGLIVVSFVEQQELSRTSSFGRYLAEQLMNEMQRHRVPVVELRQSTVVRIQEGRGEYGLSRDPAEIRPAAAAAAMLTGTYTTTPRQVIVNARIIDNRSGLLLASASTVIPRTAVVNDLLSDPVSSDRLKSEPFYMKRLGD